MCFEDKGLVLYVEHPKYRTKGRKEGEKERRNNSTDLWMK